MKSFTSCASGLGFEIGERAYYEALANGISLQENEVVLRCNIVRVEDGKLVDFTGGRLPSNIESILQEIHVPDAERCMRVTRIKIFIASKN